MKLSSQAPLIAIGVLIVIAPLVALAQWSEPVVGELIIRGGWIFDSVSDRRRRNSGIIIRNGKIAEVDADVQQQILSAVGAARIWSESGLL